MRRLLTILFLFALVLSACGPAESEEDDLPLGPTTSAGPNTDATPTSSDGVTISFAAWENERQIYESLAEKFRADNPNINVVIVPLDDMMSIMEGPGPQNPLSQLRQIVSSADTAPSYFLSPEAYGSNLLLNLGPLMDSDATFQRDDFYPGALERGTVNGTNWVLPRYVYAQILNYNKDLFKAANLPEPKADWTWTDLMGAAEQVATSGGSETYGFFDYSNGFTAMLPEIRTRKLDIFDKPAQDVRLDNPELVTLLEDYKRLGDNRVFFTQKATDTNPIDPQILVREGKIGIWPGEMLQYGGDVVGPDGSTTLPEVTFEVGKIPYPKMDVSFGYGFGGVDGFIISSGTAHPNEAWRWIEFLSRQEIEQQGQGPKGSQLGRIPARKSVAESTGYWQDIDAESAAAYQTALAAQVEVPSKTPDYTVFGPLSQALYEVMNGSKKPDAALKDAQKMLEEQIAQAAQLTPTPEADTSPVVVATPAPVVAPEGKTPIRFSLNGYQPGPLRRLAQSFNQQNPQYFVEIQNTQAMTEPLTLQQTATSSDCFSWWSTPQSETEFKALLDLQPFFDSDASFKRDDYPQAVLAPYQYNGGIYGLPYAFNVRSLNYNRTMFESAGVDAPLYSWTPENFLAAAKALTNGTGEQKQYGYVPFGGGIQSDMFFFVGQFGGKIALGSGKDAKLNFNDPKVIEAIQWYIDLAKVHGVMPEFTIPYRPNDQYEDRSYEIVQAGRAGMWFGYGGDAGPFMGEGSEMNWELGTAPLPIGQGGFRNGDLYTRGFYISASSQQAQGCWEWLKFLSNDTANLGSDIPARISIAESSEYIEKAAPAQVELYKAYAEALKKPSDISGGLDSLYTSTKYGIDMYWFYKAIDDTIKEDADLGKGLTEAQQKTTEHMACVVETEKPATCAKQVDPEYDGYNTQDPTDGPIPID